MTNDHIYSKFTTMTNDHIYSKFSEALIVRSQHPSQRCADHNSADYVVAHLQSLIYHMINEIPECAEYVKRDTELITELNNAEGVVSWLEVPAASL